MNIKALITGHKLAAAGVAVAVLIGLFTAVYFKGRGDGKAVVTAQIAEQALEAANKAREASEQATEAKDSRDDDFKASESDIQEKVDEAISNGKPAIDAWLDELRRQQAGSDKAARK